MRNENEMKKNLSEHTKEQLNPEAREHISQPRRDTTHRHIQVKKIILIGPQKDEFGIKMQIF